MKHPCPSLFLCLALLMSSASAWAVDGVAVSTHWSGADVIAYGGYGELWRHDIKDSQVVGHTLLYFDPEAPARAPVISPDGTEVAFLRQDGSIAIVSLDGGEPTVLSSAFATGAASLDWPVATWIYYNKGGLYHPSASRYLHRVNPLTEEDELVTTFKKDDGVTDAGTWRVRVAPDLRRLLVRTNDEAPEPWGRIVAVDLLEDGGRLRLDRSTDRFSCSEGLDPTGELFIDGQGDHQGIDIRRFDDLSVVATLRWDDEQVFGPDATALGHAHNLNNWSANSSDWISVHLGWVEVGDEVRGANQVLVNWKTAERVFVTDNTDGSFEFDCAGDFYVTSEDLGDTTPPGIVSVRAERQATQVEISFSEPVNTAIAEDKGAYAIAPDIEVRGANRLDAARVLLSVSPLVSGVDYELTLLRDFEDLAAVPNTLPAGTSATFEYFSGKGPLEVTAGEPTSTTVGQAMFLSGSVVRGGLPAQGPEVAWELHSGPGTAQLTDPDSLTTWATFEAPGVYELRLVATHDGETAAASLDVEVQPTPAIVHLRPEIGSQLEGGRLSFVDWTAEGVDDVTLFWSKDAGDTWEMIEFTVDTSSPYWGRYPWLVPRAATSEAVIRLEEYSQITSTTSPVFAVARGQDLAIAGPLPLSAHEAGAVEAVVVEGAEGPVLLELSLDAGRSFQPVATILPDETGKGETLVRWPMAKTHWGLLRALDTSTAAVATSGVFALGPGSAAQGAAALDHVSFTFALPKGDDLEELRVDGAAVSLSKDRTVTVDIPWSTGLESFVFELRGQSPRAMIRRLVAVELHSDSLDSSATQGLSESPRLPCRGW